MKTLREKIEGLQRWEPDYCDGVTMSGAPKGRYVELSDVHRIIAEHETDNDTLLKIAALFNGWANAGAPDGGPANVTTAAGVLTKIGAALGDPFARGKKSAAPTCKMCTEPMDHDGGPDYSCDRCGTKKTIGPEVREES